jgi:transposase-like protein
MAKSLLSAPHFHDEAAALAFIEARIWPHGPVCPKCGETVRVSRMMGKSTKLGMCKCYVCRKPFAATVGTVMESSHIPLHVWLQGMHLLCTSKKGISTNQLHRTLRITLKSAWFLSHRIREAMKEIRGFAADPLGGFGKTVEADEAWFGPKQANRAYKPVTEKQIMMALVERGGQVRSFHVPNVTAATLAPIIGRHVYRDTRFMSDESPVYTGIGWNFRSHGTVVHSAKEYVRDDAYTNTVEGYFSILKRGIYGVYQHVSEAHLKRYLAEFDFRYINRAARWVDDVARTDLAVKGIKGKRLTYRTISGNWTPPAWPPEAGPTV